MLSCFTISLRVDNQILWCIYPENLLLVHGVISLQRYGGGLAVAVTGFICWPIPKSRWLRMWIPLYLPAVENWLGSTSISLSFQSGSTDLKGCVDSLWCCQSHRGAKSQPKSSAPAPMVLSTVTRDDELDFFFIIIILFIFNALKIC